MTGPYQYPESVPPEPYPEDASSVYPGTLLPPVHYPRRRRWPRILAALLTLAVFAAVIAVVIVTRKPAQQPGVVSDEQAKAAIQEYLNALTDGDDETIARHTLCGLYDAVKDRKADLAVATLASDAFRKQFGRADVTSIDKIVPWSGTQAQVLFSMKVTPARGQQAPREDAQGVAQLLVAKDAKDGGHDEVLVCSYVLRTGGQY
ncbi:Rv0361 family membrane protein [Mycolicibacterium brisbanense]|uniref:Membrane protein n=1 Tax=Mycolicibacterium brisbanense TaxID=146020 RepID=A0A100W7F4_9MYCO|nr:hypothetical protein [Mycolicibacterium brisbanense]MCV7162715.1 hypothetical protein [Mycolicibacterium brisbanense]GAS92980.1 membrane protein [Mycolicibacterium brisbanense]